MQKKIDKTTCLVEVHFSSTSTQSVADKLKRVILHDLEQFIPHRWIKKNIMELCVGL